MIFAAFFFPAAAAVLVFFMKYVSEILQARVRLAQDEAYRAIAAQSAASLTTVGTALTEIQMRLTTIEKILKDVG
jgi:hypothetical protein